MDALTWIRSARGDVCLQGGQVTRWRRAGAEVLFLSRASRFEAGHAIRGGVPVIFPWFGDDPEGRGRGAHGFARRLPWRVSALEEAPEAIRVCLELEDDEGTRALWPWRFALRLEASLGDELGLDWTVTNRSEEPLVCEGALHTYLAVGDVRRIALHGLEGSEYLDKPTGFRRERQPAGPLAFAGEVDRVYLGSEATCRVVDPVLGRTLVVQKQGSRSTIVWNPWSARAERMADLGDDEWPSMVCVESGNVGADALRLAPGASHTMRVRIAVA